MSDSTSLQQDQSSAASHAPESPEETYARGVFNDLESLARLAKRLLRSNEGAAGGGDRQPLSLTRWTLHSPLGQESTDAPISVSSPSSVEGRIERLETTTREAARASRPGADASAGAAYELIALAGRGGMGEVWLARQDSLRRVVAVKRMRHDIYGDAQNRADLVDESAAAFCQEALVAGRLNHPNIVPVHDLGMDDKGYPLMAMKFVRGRQWSDLLREDFVAQEPRDFLAKHLPNLVQVANAVAYAHSRGVVHRDLKAGQVMIGRYGQVLLMDWGLAITSESWRLPFDEDESPDAADPDLDDRLERVIAERIDRLDSYLPTPENASSPAGTPALMAPEQTRDTAAGVGPWTDIYLLGGMLYWLLTGRYPHEAPTGRQSMLKAREGRVERPEVRADGRFVPAELADLAMNALRRDPAERVPSAELFAQRLKEYLSGDSRRKEAEALVERAESLLEAGSDSYPKLSEALASLNRAAGLGGESRRLSRAAWRALEAYARLALKRGDLALAATHARQLPEGEARAELEERVERERRRAEAHARQRRWSIAAAAALLLALIVGGYASWRDIRLERDAARSARDAAQAARDVAVRERVAASELEKLAIRRSLDAHELAEILLNEFAIRRLDLKDERDRDFRDAVVERVFEHFANVELDSSKEEVRYDYASQASLIARRFEQLGRLDVGLKMIDLADKAMEGVHEMAEAVPMRMKHLELRGDLLAEATRFPEAVESYQRGWTLANERGYGSENPTRNNFLLKTASVMASVGQPEQAQLFVQPLIDEIRAVADPTGTQVDALAAALIGSAQYAYMEKRSADALPAAEEALALRVRLFGERSAQAGEAYSLLAMLNSELNVVDRAYDYGRMAYEIHAETMGPSSRHALGDLINLSRYKTKAGEYAEAEELLRSAIEISHATLPKSHITRLMAHKNLAEALAAQGRLEEAVAEASIAADGAVESLGAAHDVAISFAALRDGMMGELRRLRGENSLDSAETTSPSYGVYVPPR